MSLHQINLRDTFIKLIWFGGNIFNISDLFDPKYTEYLRGKKIGLAKLNDSLRIISSKIDIDLILELYSTELEEIKKSDLPEREKERRILQTRNKNSEILKYYNNGLIRKFNLFTESLAKKQLCIELGIDIQEFDNKQGDEKFNKKYEERLREIKKCLIIYPELICNFPESEIERFDLQEYIALRKKSKYDFEKTRHMAEEKLSKLYAFFEYDVCSDLLESDNSNIGIILENIESINLNQERKNKFYLFVDYLAKKQMSSELGINIEEMDDKKNDEQYNKKYKEVYKKYIRILVAYPELISNFPESKLENFDIQEYLELVEKSKFDFKNERYIAERTLTKMYAFLGYKGCLEAFELPDVDEERLDQLISLSEELTKSIYEEKYQIVGKVQIISRFFKSLSLLSPDNAGKEKGAKVKSKQTQSIYRALNEKISNGYEGDLESLINSIFLELGYPLDDRLKQLVITQVKNAHTDYKLEQISVYNANSIERKVLGENQNTKQYLLAFLKKAIEESLLANEKIDLDFIRKYLESKFGEKTEQGFPRYSEHITSHLEDLISICEELNNGEYAEVLNQSIMDLIKDEKNKIGNRWIGKVLDLPDSDVKLSVDEYNGVESRIYGEDSEIEFETRMVVGLIDSSEEGIKKAYDLLVKNGVENVLTLRKAETMFGSLTEPYSEAFKNFFLQHRDVFIANLTYVTEFSRMHREFERIIQDYRFADKYAKGKLSIDEVLEEAKFTEFQGIDKGDYELAYIGKKYGKFDQKIFDEAKRLLKEMRDREGQSIPPVQHKGKKYSGRILRIDDPLHFGVGEATDCCQHIFGGGDEPMMHSALDKNGAVFIIEELDDYGQPIDIVAQSWVWRNGDRICFDNVEIKEALIGPLKKSGEMDSLLDIYIETAKEMISVDNKALQKMLEMGIISQEQYEQMKIAQVTVGVNGCDDLIRHISAQRRQKLEKATIILPFNYSGYSDAKDLQLVLVSNPEKQNSSHIDMDASVTELIYTKIREVQIRKNRDINPDIIEKIIKLNQDEKRQDGIFLENDFYERIEENISEHEDIIMHYSEMGDWYIFLRENDDFVKIEDSLVGRNFDLNSPKARMDMIMSFSEYTKELLTIISKANRESKDILLDKDREGRFGVLDILIESKILSIEDGRVTVENAEFLDETIKKLEEDLEKKSKERMLSDIGEKNDPDVEER